MHSPMHWYKLGATWLHGSSAEKDLAATVASRIRANSVHKWQTAYEVTLRMAIRQMSVVILLSTDEVAPGTEPCRGACWYERGA